jgi:hypothetical protein
MKKSEFEAILLDCEKLKRLCEERQKCSSCAPALGASRPTTRLRQVTPLAGSSPFKKSDVRAQYARKFYTLSDLHRRNDARTEPSEALRIAIEHYREHPSQTSAVQLEMAINRLGLTSTPDDKAKKLLAKAAAVLSEKTADGGDNGFKGDNIAVTFFEDADSHGSQLFANLTVGGTLTGWENLDGVNFKDEISSLTLQVSADEIGGRVFLFQDERFVGRYAQFDAAPGTQNDVGFVGSFMNDRTSSVLIYRQFANELIQQVAEFVPPGTIEALISGTSGLSSRGAPVFTWDLFPDGSDGHPNAQSTMFIYIRIPVTVDVPHWFDYDAEIRFWTSPFIDESGSLQVPLNFFGAWVEGGILTGDVMDRLMGPDGIPSEVGQVENLFASAARVANLAAPFSSLYLLPGRNEAQGNTDDDVTLVLLQGAPPTPGPIL